MVFLGVSGFIGGVTTLKSIIHQRSSGLTILEYWYNDEVVVRSSQILVLGCCTSTRALCSC